MHQVFMKKQWRLFLENNFQPSIDILNLKKRLFGTWQLLSQYPQKIEKYNKKVAMERDENGNPISAFRIEDLNKLIALVKKVNINIENIKDKNGLIQLRSDANKIQSMILHYVDFLDTKFRIKNHPGINQLIDELKIVSERVFELLNF